MAVGAEGRDDVRPKVLIGAYACGPGDEPEGAAGWAFATAAARDYDVWVVTRERFRPAISMALEKDAALSRRLRVVYLDLPSWVVRLKRGPGSLYWYYSMWQRRLTLTARRMHRQVGFDVLHHVTFANDWLPCGLVGVDDVPLVWGPVGGASRPIWKQARWLGLRGTVTESLRAVFVGPARRVFGDRAARRSAIVVAQNDDVGSRFSFARSVVVHPNAAMDASVAGVERTAEAAGDSGRRPRAVMVSRLLGWKGGRLALAALARDAASTWDLTIYGEGYERRVLERRVSRLGLGERVVFAGHRPRREVLRAIADADALLFPSMHDQAGWVAAEASSLGTRVVCFPAGGPSLLAGSNAVVVPMHGDVPAHLADGLALALREPGTPDHRWSAERLPDVVADWYAAATASDSKDAR